MARVRSSPRTLSALASMPIATRSDFAAFCDGVDRICDQLALLIMSVEDELYRRLVASSGRSNISARSKARRAVRPLRFLAVSITAIGRQAPKAYRHYQRVYAEEITPEQARKKPATFNHRA